MVTLDNGIHEGDSFETGHMERDIPGSGSKVSAIVPASVALPGLTTFVAGHLGQLLGFSSISELNQFPGLIL